MLTSILVLIQILKGSWDDVIRKTEPVEKEKKELPELNFEKSKEGLAAEYEKMVTYFSIKM